MPKTVSEWLTLNGRNATIKGRMRAAWVYKIHRKICSGPADAGSFYAKHLT